MLSIIHSHYACLGSVAVNGLFWSDRRQNTACSYQLGLFPIFYAVVSLPPRGVISLIQLDT